MERLHLSVIALSYNDENIIGNCLKSVQGWVEEIFVVDSYSQDGTVDIIKSCGGILYQHRFDNYAAQRNWALDNLPVKTGWVLCLDSDQRVTPELKKELFDIFSDGADKGIDGYIAKTRTVFMGKWVKHGGHYPIYRVYMFRKGAGRYEDRKYHQHCVVTGKIGKLENDIVDIIASDIDTFVERINRWSLAEAEEMLDGGESRHLRAKFFGGHIERKRWLSTKFYWRLPLFTRVFAYFFFRYFILKGFLDGTEGLIFHMIQGFYMHFLTDAKIYEKRMRPTANKEI